MKEVVEVDSALPSVFRSPVIRTGARRRKRVGTASAAVSAAGTEYALESTTTNAGYQTSFTVPDKITLQMGNHLANIAEWIIYNSKSSNSRGEELSIQGISGYLIDPVSVLLHDYVLSNIKRDPTYDPQVEMDNNDSGLKLWLKNNNME